LNEDGAPVWVLLGHRTGDNKQLLRLAGELGLPFRSIHLCYNRLHLLPPRPLGDTLRSLTAESREQIHRPWPRLVLGVGHRSVPVALAIRRLSGGKSKLVRLGNPRIDPSHFDLVVTTPQYRLPDRSNVMQLPLGINTAAAVEPTPDEAKWLASFPRPHRLLLIGGNTFMWELRPEKVAEATRRLKDKPDGTVTALRSGRTRREVLDAVTDALKGGEHAVASGGFPRYSVLIQDADEIFVTGDSVAMVSDAIASRKPVGIIEPDKSVTGRFLYALDSIGLRVPVRDIRQFWVEIERQGLVGTIDEPKCGPVTTDTLSEAKTAVLKLLEP
jgi:mitochondrial fission protein ELM1